MRSVVMSNRIRFLAQAASLAVLGGVVAGCSSGFSRFDTSVYQDGVPQSTAASNPYPGDIDTTTTASTGRRLVPLNPVAPAVVPQGTYHSPEPTYAARQPASQYGTAYAPPQSQNTGIQRSTLPQVNSYNPAPAYSDPLTTASVDPMVDGKGGWTSAGGTRITVRDGETLYNISKRYGVPVTALKQANGITNPTAVQAGQQIVVPNYVYSANAPNSMPDIDPNTRAASAGVGVEKPVTPSKVETSVASDGRYTVKSGDSLSRIASRHGVTTKALMDRNGLSTSVIRIGQTLSIPDSSYVSPSTNSTVASTKSSSTNSQPVDTVVTGSAAPDTRVSNSNVASVDDDEAAPKRTGISDFRWPVRGRVVSSFGEQQRDGRNDGIDISVPEGTAVRAAENGVVIYTGSEISTYGKLVLIRHEDGWVSAYAHNRDYAVQKGDKVRRGEIIARSGKTGDADRPAVHFELRKNSNPVDPQKHLAGA